MRLDDIEAGPGHGPRDALVRAGKARWEALADLVQATRLADAAEWTALSAGYRDVVADLARARAQEVGDDLVAYLDHLASRAHARLYGRSRRWTWASLTSLLWAAGPRAVRANAGWVAVAHLLFYGSFALGATLAVAQPELAEGLAGSEALRSAEQMYASPIGERDAGQNAMMAGFYVYNNAGIALRCFATGALFGLGTVVVTVFNGLMIGVVFGHLFEVGLGDHLANFVAGHAAWELTGICLAAAGGLRLGWALMAPGGLSRAASVRQAGPELFGLALAAVELLLAAAAVEGFWSATALPLAPKLVVGALGVVAVVAWLLRAGRA